MKRPGAVALLALAGALGWVGLTLLVDRPGLRVEYFAIEPEWRGRPVDTDIGLPELENRRQAGFRVMSQELFSIRWRGWIRIDREGRYRFSVAADERAYLKLDDRELAAIGADGGARATGRRRLTVGWHALEIGMAQTGGPVRLETSWAPPRAASSRIPPDLLYAERPGPMRPLLRRWLAPVAPPLRRLLGTGLLLTAALLLAVPGRRWVAAGGVERVETGSGRVLGVVLPLALFAVVWWLVFRFTARTVDGDDIRYLDVAMFDRKQGWILNRYSHVYLLRIFVWLTGDGFLAARHYWSFACAGTVAALAAAAGAYGHGLQVRTLGVALFLLFSQVTIWGTIGAAFADYSTMLFVTAAVAVYLVGSSRQAEIVREWPAFWIGALTVLAYRSKETGLVLVWLLLLLLWCDGRVDWRRFGRRAGFWLGGAAVASLFLMTLDGLLLGDFWFSLRPVTVEALRYVNFADLAPVGRGAGSWMEVVWQPGVAGRPRDHSLRHLALLVLAAAVVVAILRRRVETGLLHLLPLVYLAFLLVAHVRANFVYSPRQLLPILPVACLLAAALFYHLGIEEPPWRRLFSPPVLLTLVPAAAVVWLILAPYRIGELAAESFVPAAILGRFGWRPEGFVDLTLEPLVVLALFAALAFALRAPRPRLLIALVFLPFLFGTAFELTRLSLVRGGAVQRSDLILYPWDAFGEEIAASNRRRLFVSSELLRRYGMGGQGITRNRIATVYFRRDGMVVEEIAGPAPRADWIIASRREVERWREEEPELQAAVTPDASGEVVLLRRQAAPGG